MDQVWIVYHDSGPDNNILGVFGDADEAAEYQERVASLFEGGALMTPFPVPWRYTDRVTEVSI